MIKILWKSVTTFKKANWPSILARYAYTREKIDRNVIPC